MLCNLVFYYLGFFYFIAAIKSKMSEMLQTFHKTIKRQLPYTYDLSYPHCLIKIELNFSQH